MALPLVLSLWLGAGCGTGTQVTPGDVSGDSSSKPEAVSACTTDQDCNDNNPCTLDLCLSGGQCKNKPQAGASCDDGNACTEGDLCDAAGECGGEVVFCKKPDPCKKSECDTVLGCVIKNADDGTACTDGNACTVVDSCSEGACAPGKAVECSDSNQQDCVVPTCSPATGGCDDMMPAPEGTACKDGNPCTTGDSCSADGKCTGGEPVDCKGELSCWNGWCNEQAKEGDDPCVGDWKDEGVGCDDGSECTTNDKCTWMDDKMACAGQPVNCDDDSPCTVESCEAGVGCTYETLAEGSDCSSGDGKCFVVGKCQDGECVGSGPKCYDENPCTDNVCDGQTGECHFVPNDKPCDDGNPCTAGDVCSGGGCGGSPALCLVDDNPCTQDTCDPQTGKCGTPEPDGTSCDDSDPCTLESECSNGACVGVSGTIKTCPAPASDVSCKHLVCNPMTGDCELAPESDGTPCDDGFECTGGDVCSKGQCLGETVLCSLGHQVIEIPVDVAQKAVVSEGCAELVLPTAFLEPYGVKEGDVLLSKEQPMFLCRASSLAAAGSETTVNGEPASLEDVVLFGKAEVALPVLFGDTEVLPAKSFSKDIYWDKEPPVAIPLPEAELSFGAVKLQMKDASIWFYPKIWLFLKFDGGLKEFQIGYSGKLIFNAELSFKVDAAAILSGQTDGKLVGTVWSPPNGGTVVFPFGIPCVIKPSFELGFYYDVDAAFSTDISYHSESQVETIKRWTPAEGWTDYKKEVDPPAQKNLEWVGIASGKVGVFARPIVSFLVLGAAGPFVGAGVAGEAVVELKTNGFVSVLAQVCLRAWIGGNVKPIAKVLDLPALGSLPELELDLKCWKWPLEYCLDECLVVGKQCTANGSVETCQSNLDEDQCLDLSVGICPAGTKCLGGECICLPKTCKQLGKQCNKWDDGCGKTLDCGVCSGTDQCDATGNCVTDCTPKTCQQLGKECGNWDDGCGKQIPCGTCTGGNCVAGACVPCKSDFCQTSGYSSGQYCKDASTLVTCKIDGACKVEVEPPQTCTSGCANNKCNVDKCTGVQCPCQKCAPATGSCVPDATKEGTSCGNGKTCIGGACVCESNFCQDGGYSSGTYCKDAGTQVGCTTQGACKVEKDETFCQNGCVGGNCKAGPTCGDGSCDSPGETKCSCPQDCGTCSGCCSGTSCLVGTEKGACGKGGASCVVCQSPQTCDGGQCQQLSCPNDCSGHGSCNGQTGTCSCNEGYSGSACSQCASGYQGYPNCVVQLQEVCNGLDDDGDGIIDSQEECWVPVYRWWNTAMPLIARARCWGNSASSPPSGCSGYTLEFDGPVFYLYASEQPGTANLVHVYKGTDHLLLRDFDNEIATLLGKGYSQGETIGAIWSDNVNPPEGTYYCPAGAKTCNIRNLRRYYKQLEQLHLFPNNPAETAPGWASEGIKGFVWGSRW